jgi:O-antigen ligase
MSGRTVAWEEGWTYLAGSPWVGLGFQSDRYFLHTHMHNAFLHVLFQAGFLGGGGILIGYAIVSYYVIKYFFLTKPADKSLIPPEIPAIFLFVTISSITESTFAYFSATWLMGAPIVAYVMALHQHMRAISAKATQERTLRLQLARRAFRAGRSSGGTAAPPLGSSGGVNAL